MGTVLQVTSGVAAMGVVIAFGILFYIKLNALDIKIRDAYTYRSRHAPENVQPVPRTYFPAGGVLRYREMWRARIEGTAEFLRVPVGRLEECYQKNLAERLSNWKWMTVPSNEWPTIWTS